MNKEKIEQNISNDSNIIQFKENANNILTEKYHEFSTTKDINDEILYNKIGFRNLCNTCYANSCLKVLIHCQPFIYKFLENIKIIVNKYDTLSFNFI